MFDRNSILCRTQSSEFNSGAGAIWSRIILKMIIYFQMDMSQARSSFIKTYSQYLQVKKIDFLVVQISN
jgi:hypothetical protein